MLWNQSFGSAGEGWDGPLRATHSCEHFRGAPSLSGPGSYARTRRMFPAPVLVSGFTSCRPG